MLWLEVLLCADCQPQCQDSCTALTGNVHLECDECDVRHACRPGAHGWHRGHQATRQVPGECNNPSEQALVTHFETLTALPEEVFWESIGTFAPDCSDAEDPTRLASRGYAVARQVLAPAQRRVHLSSISIDDDGVGRTPGRFRSESFTAHTLQGVNPGAVTALEGLVAAWQEKRLLPPAAQQSLPQLRLEQMYYIRVDPRVALAERCGDCFGLWHVDTSILCPRVPRLIAMLERHQGNASHGNVLVASHSELERLALHAVQLNVTRATRGDGGCAPLDAAGDGGAGVCGGQWAETEEARVLRARAHATALSASRAAQGVAVSGLPKREVALERVGCVQQLAAGDVLFFGGDVYHRTQDTGRAGRISLMAQLANRASATATATVAKREL